MLKVFNQSSFSVTQFRKGRWYATEQFDTKSKCLTYDFKEEANQANQTQPKEKFVVKVYYLLTRMEHNDKTQSFLYSKAYYTLRHIFMFSCFRIIFS